MTLHIIWEAEVVKVHQCPCISQESESEDRHQTLTCQSCARIIIKRVDKVCAASKLIGGKPNDKSNRFKQRYERTGKGT